MKTPIAVLISDVHYNINTLPLADAAVRLAAAKANLLDVPLVVAGDLHDTKANLRGECISAMLKTFDLCRIPAIILRGNHDSINEKSQDHSLEFLKHDASIIASPVRNLIPNVTFIPYSHDPISLKIFLKSVCKGSMIIMHQGIEGSYSGEYIQDKSAITYDDVKDFRVISGHYHRRQDIKTGAPQKGHVGIFSYIGNPYTLNFAEADDPEKGYQILMDDGSLEFVATNLRRHKVITATYVKDAWMGAVWHDVKDNDLVLVKMHAPSDILSNVTKDSVRLLFYLKSDFRLDLIPADTKTVAALSETPKTQDQVLDGLIDSLTGTDTERKERLKSLWRAFI